MILSDLTLTGVFQQEPQVIEDVSAGMAWQVIHHHESAGIDNEKWLGRNQIGVACAGEHCRYCIFVSVQQLHVAMLGCNMIDERRVSVALKADIKT